MKQEMITYLSTVKDELLKLSHDLHNCCEDSYHECNNAKLISNFLAMHNFNINENYLDIKTSFFAQKGDGHPKICFLCEYDSDSSVGDILATNLRTTMSVGAAILIGNSIDKIGGSVIVIGCPGELKGGSKSILVKQGAFEDIDTVLTARPHVVTAESGTSLAVLPIEINYSTKDKYYNNNGFYSSLDACLYTLNGLNVLINGYGDSCFINGVSIKSPSTPYFSPTITKITFYIKAKTMETLKDVDRKIRIFVKNTAEIMNVDSEIHLHELPCGELISNKVLGRIFSHNLKEAGIINILPPRDTHLGMSLGSVSAVVPTISPFISVVNDNSIEPYSKAFAALSVSTEVEENLFKAIQSLAFTGYDLLAKEDLIAEAKKELHDYIKNNDVTY